MKIDVPTIAGLGILAQPVYNSGVRQGLMTSPVAFAAAAILACAIVVPPASRLLRRYYEPRHTL